MKIKSLVLMAAAMSTVTVTTPVSAASFAYDFNTKANVDSFAATYLHGLASRASFQGNAYMRVMIAPTDSNFSFTENLTEDTFIESESSAPQAAELIYRVRFSSNFEFERQGKLPGIGSFTPHYGGNKDDPPAKDSWSHRLMWFPASTSIKRPDMYLYDQSRLQGNTGTHHTAPSTFTFAKNVWYRIKMVTILNSVSSTGKANSDGKAILYVNDVQAVCRDGLRFRGDNSTNKGRIGRLAFHVYHGGPRSVEEMPTSGSTYVDFDYFNYKSLSVTGINRKC